MSEQSCRDEYDAKLRAFLKTLHPTGRYAIYVKGPKDEIVGFARGEEITEEITES